MAEESYRMSEVLSFCDWETVKLPSIKIAVLTFLVKKVQLNFARCLFFESTPKNFESNRPLVVVFVLES